MLLLHPLVIFLIELFFLCLPFILFSSFQKTTLYTLLLRPITLSLNSTGTLQCLTSGRTDTDTHILIYSLTHSLTHLLFKGSLGVRGCCSGGFAQVCGVQVEVQLQACQEPGLQGPEAHPGLQGMSPLMTPAGCCHILQCVFMLLLQYRLETFTETRSSSWNFESYNGEQHLTPYSLSSSSL